MQAISSRESLRLATVATGSPRPPDCAHDLLVFRLKRGLLAIATDWQNRDTSRGEQLTDRISDRDDASTWECIERSFKDQKTPY